MAKTKRRSFGKFVRGAVKDVVMPTSMGLGIALAGCGSSGDKADGPMAVMPPADAAGQRDGYAIMPPVKDAAIADTRRPDVPVYAILPPAKDAAIADSRGSEIPSYPIFPPNKDAGRDTRDSRPDYPVYAVMPIRVDAAADVVAPDADLDKRDATPDTTKPPKEVGPIYAIMPLAVLPPRG